jgi:hypothetical protein
LRDLASFSVGSIVKKLNRIRIHIDSKYNRPFPKLECFLLSKYAYKPRHIKIHPDGRLAGGLPRFVSSLVDFSFIRSIVAHKYKVVGFAYDPVSLFLLQLFRYLEKSPSMKDFVEVVRDREKGRHYRMYAGIRWSQLPCEATFTNLKARLGEELYNQIFHVLVEIAELLGFLSYKVLATDGTLFQSNSRYKGCTYFCSDCREVEFKGIIENVRRRIRYRLADPARIIPGKEIRIKVECPSSKFPSEIQKPKIEVLTLCLQEADLEKPSIFNQIFGLQDELQNAGLDLVVRRGILTKIVLTEGEDSFFFRCPKLPSDMDAKIGVRRNPQNPNRKQKIFGFNAIIDTSIELELGVELPVACTTIAGNAHEGQHFITNKKQILHYHEKSAKIQLADAKYDELKNYAFSRSQGAIPVIDYNSRREDLSKEALRNRGYDQNGWPYAPCGVVARPNGFDSSCQRASFSCRRKCLQSADQNLIQYSNECPHWINYHGFTKHMSVRQFPRLITEVIRGTDRYHKIKTLRSAAERTNSTAKEDFCILSKPKIRGIKMAGVLAQVAVMIVLLKRISKFIVRVTLVLRSKLRDTRSSQHNHISIPGPKLPPFIAPIIARE